MASSSGKMLEIVGTRKIPGTGKSTLRQVNPDGTPYEGNQAGQLIPLPRQAAPNEDLDLTEPMESAPDQSSSGKARGGRVAQKSWQRALAKDQQRRAARTPQPSPKARPNW